MAYKYQTADPLLYGLLKEFAKKNRKFQTEAESYLWNFLRNNNWGYKFQRQHIIYDYIADFVCLEANLVIEVDGGYHSQYEQMIKDEARTKVLNKIGFSILRFSNEEIFENIEAILNEIYTFIKSKKILYKFPCRGVTKEVSPRGDLEGAVL